MRVTNFSAPEPKSLLSLGAADHLSGSGNGHTKIGAGHKPQPYDGHGRYTGPGGGSAAMGNGEIRLNMEDADNAPDDAQDDGGAEQEPEADDAPEVTDILLADSGRTATDADGGLSGGNEVRGPVTPPGSENAPPLPPAPPAPKEPHLVYSQSTGEMTGPDGKTVAVGYAGRGGGLNNPDAEGIKGVGPLPQGNWRMEELDRETCEKKGWPPPAYRLTPDEETRERVNDLGRDPDSFYVHAKAAKTEDQGRESWGCIALDKPERKALRAYNGRWIRVER